MRLLLRRIPFICNKPFSRGILLYLCVCMNLTAAFSRQTDSLRFLNDTTTLNNVTVSAFAANTQWKEVAAAVAVINQPQLHRFENASLIPVINTVPGVRMEERSPGSYRLSIRGSLLRSPFGVRNVKLYWNDIPFTDAGGNTYLQLVDLNQLSSIEIIKGPASSLYGANTGGAVILHPDLGSGKGNQFNAGIGGGSYGLFNEHAGWTSNSASFNSSLQQSHLQSDGYRQQSRMRRDAVKWNGIWNLNSHQKLSFFLAYTDLYYQTPGGLTKQQMDSAPTMARAIAISQKAAIYNKTAFSGFSLASTLSKQWNNITTVTLNHTDFTNPFITNYEKRNEWNYGARTSFDYHLTSETVSLHWLTGAEWQQNYSAIDDYDNNKGEQGNVQFKDQLYATQYFLFTQLNLTLHNRFSLQAGLSSNKQLLRYKRASDPSFKSYINNNTNTLLAPRFSLLYKLTNSVSAYTVAAKGFSPPTLAEVHPSDGNYYNLQPERGWNYEVGLKGFAIKSSLEFDASFYYFTLNNAIVRRLNDAGAEYFVNAGKTVQKGVEVWARYHVLNNRDHFVSNLAIGNSFTYQPYRFDSYISGSNDYSGNKLTGVASTVNVTSVDLETNKGIYTNATLNCTGRIPLNDGNSIYADKYQLLQWKLGYKRQWQAFQLDFFVMADNLLNQSYSLGNDINAAGNRYFNPSARRNFIIGTNVRFW